MNRRRVALTRAYENAVYTAELPAGQVEFRIGARPIGPAPAGVLAIITAWNPGFERPSAADNRKANQRLSDLLHTSGWTVHPASGRNLHGTHEEPSLAIMGVDPESALAFARRFNQAAILYWDGTAARLLWC
ncbi:MAG: DUF3293 domain-containing protein [Gammaproteobacteria bacterium]